MISSPELNRALYGVIRLARGDANGISYFNASVQGFWNSVAAAVIVLPGFIFITWVISYQDIGAEVSAFRIIVVEAISYVVGWTAAQLALYYYCQATGNSEQFLRLAVALNWADVPIIAARVVLILLLLAGLPLDSLGFILNIAIIAYVIFITRAALKSTLLVAVGPVVILLILGVMLNAVAKSMAGLG